MNKFKLAVALCALALVTANVSAQNDRGGRGMRNTVKGRLTGLIRGIGALERDSKSALSAGQARSVVAAIAPWRTRPRMDESGAKALFVKLNGVLTIKQKNALDRNAAKNRRFHGSGGGMGGSDRRDRNRQRTPEEMAKMRREMQGFRNFSKTVNPFYPPSKYPEVQKAPERMREGMLRRYETTRKLLAELSRKAGIKK